MTTTSDADRRRALIERLKRELGEDGEIHVTPPGRGHVQSDGCWCGPVRLADEPLIVVHNDVVN